ncbi:hypothetical protein D3C85_1260290 [compost metagenome]
MRGQGDQPQFGTGQRVVPIALGPRFGFAAANERHDRRQHFAAVGFTTLLRYLGPHVITESAHGVQVRMNGEDRLGPTRTETPATTGGTGLDQHRSSLWRARNVQWAFDLEPLALVLHRVNLRRISQHPAFPIQLQRVRSPAAPQLQRHFDEFVGAVVTQVMLQVLVLAEQTPFAVVHRGHDIPGRTAPGQVIQGGEFPGDMRRFVIGGGTGSP